MDSTLPTIDIFLPICGEPIEVLNNTWLGVKDVIANYKGKIIAYVLDDSNLQINKELAGNFNFEYIVRENRPTLKKAGNLRNAFKNTNGDFIFILDADFRPLKEALDHLLPYMIENENIAIVQSPQFFEINKNHTYIQNGAAYVQELYYRFIQVIRNYWKVSNCVGSCALYRRTALEPLGGTAAKHHSEDLWTGFLITNNGLGIVYYIPIAITKGLCPDTIKQFFNQQYRWCAGTIALCLSKEYLFEFSGNWVQKYFYFQGFLYYFLTTFFLLLYPCMNIYTAWKYPTYLLGLLAFVNIPRLLAEVVILAMWTKNKFGLYYFFARYLSSSSHLFAFIDMILGTPMPWTPTGVKETSNKKSGYNRYLLFVIIYPTLILIASFLLTLLPTTDNYVYWSRWGLVIYQLISMYITVLPIIDEENILRNKIKQIFKLTLDKE